MTKTSLTSPSVSIPRLSNLCLEARLTRTVIVTLILSLAAACGAPKKSGEGAYNSCVPDALKYIPRDNGVFLQWRPNCGSAGARGGYRFYIVPDSELTPDFPLDVTEPFNSAPYPGDTNADQSIETVELRSLLNGAPYTAVVRNLLADGSESRPSNVIHFTPMPGGEFSLQVRYKGENDGFDFASASAQRADNARNDLYFVSSAKGDFLGSPSKLSFGLKSTRFRKVGAFNSLLEAAGVESSGAKSDEIKIKAGDVIEALIENNHFVRLRVMAISGVGKERTARFEYLYQSAPAVNSF